MGETVDVQIAKLQGTVEHIGASHEKFSTHITKEIFQLREQTHEWMQQMLNRLPTWAVIVGGGMCTSIGAMAMWIITHH